MGPRRRRLDTRPSPPPGQLLAAALRGARAQRAEQEAYRSANGRRPAGDGAPAPAAPAEAMTSLPEPPPSLLPPEERAPPPAATCPGERPTAARAAASTTTTSTAGEGEPAEPRRLPLPALAKAAAGAAASTTTTSTAGEGEPAERAKRARAWSAEQARRSKAANPVAAVAAHALDVCPRADPRVRWRYCNRIQLAAIDQPYLSPLFDDDDDDLFPL